MERITRAERLEQELAQSEARLRESEDRYRQMFEKNRAIKLLIAPESGQIIDANPAACEFYGYPRAEFQTKNIKEINTLSAAEVDAEMARAAGEQRAYFVFRHRLASGAVRDVEVYSSPIEAGGRCLLYSIINDITERKQAEQALRSNVQLFRTLVENAEDLITIFNRDWTIRYESPAVEKMLGFKPSELRGRHLLETVHPCDRRAILRAMKYKTEHPGELVPVKGRIRHKDGSYRILEGRSVNLLENPAVGGIVANTRDVTERERAEAALRESEEKFRLIVETTNEWIWSMDREGRSIYDNPAVEMLLGYSPDELRGRDMSELMHEEDRRMMEQQLPAFFAAKRGWTGLICRYRHKDGSYRYLESNAAPVLDARGELAGYRGADRDVTDRVRAQQALSEKEEQLRQAQKMEAIGQLAGGVAHDFNNLLTAILGYSELLLRDLPPDAAPSRHKVEEIKHAGERAATLTRQLLAFSRKQMLQPKVLNPNVVALGVEKMLRRLLGEHLELRLKLEPAVGLIKADPGQLEQVVINLSINARDAMPEGGKLLVETRNVELDEHYAGRRADVVRPGRYVMLAVSDTGTGIEPQIQERIFDPFFTTKEQGKGTGLGLSTVYGIVKQSEGHLWVYSEPGRGTTFKVYLPRVDEPADLAAAGATTVPAAAVPGGAETVLLVEDEEIVRELTREMLELIGYRVVAAADGAEALEIARRQPANWPGLLVTDVVMPRMSGRELSGRLRAFHPQVKTLFMSGYTEAAIVQHGVIDSDIAFLPKPFTLDDLARKLREVIDAPDKNTLGNQ